MTAVPKITPSIVTFTDLKSKLIGVIEATSERAIALRRQHGVIHIPHKFISHITAVPVKKEDPQ